MVTKEQAVEAGMHGGTFHYGTCTENRKEQWRANGACKVWKTRPDEFRLPIKFGIRDYSYLTDLNAAEFHRDSDCPLLKEDASGVAT